MTLNELRYYIDRIGCSSCLECKKNKDLMMELYKLENNMMIESILKSVRTILDVKDFRYTRMTIGDLKNIVH